MSFGFDPIFPDMRVTIDLPFELTNRSTEIHCNSRAELRERGWTNFARRLLFGRNFVGEWNDRLCSDGLPGLIDSTPSPELLRDGPGALDVAADLRNVHRRGLVRSMHF
jgi:hypothetical protein